VSELVSFAVGCFLLLFSLVCMADQEFNGAEVICLPESNVFRVQHKTIDAPEPPNLKACKLRLTTFEIAVQTDEPRERGRCAAQPATWLHIKRNGASVVGPAWFGSSCGQGPSISSVEYFGPLDRLTVCVSQSGLMTGAEVCAEAKSADLPVDRMWMRRIVKDAREEP